MTKIICDGWYAHEAVGRFVKNYVLERTNEACGGGLELVSGEFIVSLAPLYYEDEEPIPDNEYLDIDMNGDCFWMDDWDEGQKIVLVYGITPIEEVKPYWICGEEEKE